MAAAMTMSLSPWNSMTTKIALAIQTSNNSIASSLSESHPSFAQFETSGSGVTAMSGKSIHHGEIPPQAQALWIKKEDRWPLGHTIKATFLEQPMHCYADYVECIIKRCADMWTRDTNIRFQFLTTAADPNGIQNADLRITFQPGVSWSVIGTQALREPGRTMNLAVEPWHAPDQICRMAFHEFGHALGFRHEHASPASALRLDRAQWMRDTGQTEKDFEVNFEREMDGRPRLVSKFDRHSIMIYEILPEWRWNVGGDHVPLNMCLSVTDKAMAKIAYPFQQTNRRLVDGRWYCRKRTCRPTRAQCDLCKHLSKDSTSGE